VADMEEKVKVADNNKGKDTVIINLNCTMKKISKKLASQNREMENRWK